MDSIILIPCKNVCIEVWFHLMLLIFIQENNCKEVIRDWKRFEENQFVLNSAFMC